MRARATLGSLLAIVWVVSLNLPSRPVVAQTSSQKLVYVTTFDGNVYEVDANAAVPATRLVHHETVVHGETVSNAPLEDAAIGPDGKIYVCVSLEDYIFRIRPDGTDYEVVYRKLSETDPEGPEGISFTSNGDAYFNTRGNPKTHSGVWKLPGVGFIPSDSSSLPFGGENPATKAVVAFSDFGEGTTTKTADGSILMVDSTSCFEGPPCGRVLRTPANPPVLPDPAPTVVLTGLSDPIGIDTDNLGRIIVAEQGSGNVTAHSPDGEFSTVLFNLEGVLYLEHDHGGQIFAVNFFSEDTGLWRFDPASETQLTKLVDISQPVGIAIGHTSVSLTRNFSPGDTEEDYDYGVARVRLRFDNVLRAFALTLTRAQQDPAAVNADITATFPNARCIRDTKDGGACNFIEAGPFLPRQGLDFRGKFHISWYFNTQEVIETYSMLHDPSGVYGTAFNEDITDFFSLFGGPDDPMGDGSVDNFQRFVQTNSRFTVAPYDHLHFPCQISPSPTADPPTSFPVGTTTVVPIRFKLANQPGCLGGFDGFAIPILTVLRESDGRVMPVKWTATSGNFFDFNWTTMRYFYQLKAFSTLGYTPGTYVATVQFKQGGSGARPFTTRFAIAP